MLSSSDHLVITLPVMAETSAMTGPTLTATQALEAFVARLKPTSLRAYQRDLRWWCRTATVGSAADLVHYLVQQGPGPVNLLALQAVAALRTQCAPATTNRRLAALRSLLSALRLLGLITWTVEVKGLKRVLYRDTRGPGVPAIQRMLTIAEQQMDPVGADRDTAIIWLLYGCALRVSEVSSLSMGDMERDQSRLWILGKGQDERMAITVPQQAWRAVQRWTAHRRDAAPVDPLFIALDLRHHGHRLTTRSIHRVVVKLGLQAGVTTWPHGLRHAAITMALDNGADVRHVRRFSRHAGLDVLLHYDDNRQDLGGKVAQQVADTMSPGPEALVNTPP